MRDEFEFNFRGRRVVPPLPPGVLAAINELTIEEPCEAGEPDLSSAATAFILYRDRSGCESRRRITFKRLTGYFGELEYVDCYCHERRKFRRFAISGIREMMCPFTGELFDPFERCLELQGSGALRIDDMVLTELARLMVWMARCDGAIHPLEDAAIEDVFGRYIRFFGGDDATHERAVIESRKLSPDGGDAGKALRALKRCPEGPQVARFVLDGCAGVIDADGRHAPEEVTWALEVSDALKKIASRNQ